MMAVTVLSVVIVAGYVLYSRASRSALHASLVEELERGQEIVQAKDTVERNWQTKLEVAEEVIAGRLSVAEALEQFRTLYRQQFPPVTRQSVMKERKMSEDEWLGDMFLYFVDQVLLERPDQKASTRIKQEVQQVVAERRQKRSAAD
jgi:hypothetical protein